jgi:hypothetical protein
MNSIPIRLDYHLLGKFEEWTKAVRAKGRVPGWTEYWELLDLRDEPYKITLMENGILFSTKTICPHLFIAIRSVLPAAVSIEWSYLAETKESMAKDILWAKNVK